MTRASSYLALVLAVVLTPLRTVSAGCDDELLHNRLQSMASGTETFHGTKLWDTVNVSAVQYPIRYKTSLEHMLERLDSYVTQAAKAKSQVVMFPELFVLDRLNPDSSLSDADQLKEIARKETPIILERMKAHATRLRMHILAGSVPVLGTDGKIRNVAHLFFPDGSHVGQTKMFLTPDEVEWGWTPGNELKLFRTPWGLSVILICYDSQFPAVSQALMQASPELIFVPSMTGEKGQKRVRWAAQARAVEHHAYVVVTGTTDAEGGSEYVGQAAFLTPQEEGFPGLLRQGKMNRDQVVSASFDLAKVRKSKSSSGLYPGRDQISEGRSIRIIPPK